MKHKHNPQCGCKHVLKYCTCCDTVYCDKCGKEWYKNSFTWYSPSTYTIGEVTTGGTIGSPVDTTPTITCSLHKNKS